MPHEYAVTLRIAPVRTFSRTNDPDTSMLWPDSLTSLFSEGLVVDVLYPEEEIWPEVAEYIAPLFDLTPAIWSIHLKFEGEHVGVTVCGPEGPLVSVTAPKETGFMMLETGAHRGLVFLRLFAGPRDEDGDLRLHGYTLVYPQTVVYEGLIPAEYYNWMARN